MGGLASGEALVSRDQISFLGGVDAATGIVIERGHSLYGACVKNKILMFPGGKGSTVGSYVIFSLKKHNVAPAAMINQETETIIATGCVVAAIPLVDRPGTDIFEVASTGDHIELDADKQVVTVRKKLHS